MMMKSSTSAYPFPLKKKISPNSTYKEQKATKGYTPTALLHQPLLIKQKSRIEGRFILETNVSDCLSNMEWMLTTILGLQRLVQTVPQENQRYFSWLKYVTVTQYWTKVTSADGSKRKTHRVLKVSVFRTSSSTAKLIDFKAKNKLGYSTFPFHS